jgi:hypothetical protein
VVETRVIKTGDQMGCTRPRGGYTDPEFPRELGMRRRHEGGHLLVSDLDELDLSFGTLQCPEHAIDPVARITIDSPHAPLIKALNEEVADGHGHGIAVLAVRG